MLCDCCVGLVDLSFVFKYSSTYILAWMLLLCFIEHGLFLFDEDRAAAVTTVLSMHVFRLDSWVWRWRSRAGECLCRCGGRCHLLGSVRPSVWHGTVAACACVFVRGRMDCCNVWVVGTTTYRLLAVMFEGCVLMFGVDMHRSVVY